MIAVVYFLNSWWKNSKIIRERKQAKLILITVFITIITGGITDIVLPMLKITIIPSIAVIIAIIPIIGIWYSIKKYKLMDLNPENFGLEVLKIMNEGLVIVNSNGLINYINKGAIKLLGYEKNQIINKSIRFAFSEEIDLSNLISCSSVEIELLQNNGKRLPIGEWVMRSACIQNRTWQEAGILNVTIAVNLSVNQFQKTRIAQLITRILEETKLNPKDLEIEITENIIMKETEYIIESLKQLKQLGVKIAIDDFGTEYSSLNYIKQLPVDRIKIDISYIQGIGKNDKDEAIINAIIVLARNLGLRVISEGVETKE